MPAPVQSDRPADPPPTRRTVERMITRPAQDEARAALPAPVNSDRPADPPPRGVVERAITPPERSEPRAPLPAPARATDPAAPRPLPPRIISEAAPPLQDKREARVAPAPIERARPLQRAAAPQAKEPEQRATREKPPFVDAAAPNAVGRNADRRSTAEPPPAPARSALRPTPAPPEVRSAARPKPTPPLARPAAPRETQTASLPPARVPVQEEEGLRVVFSGSSSRLTGEGEAKLRALVQSVAETETRIQLKAFAAGSADRPSTARRLSLSRALAVRSFLIEQGLRSTRIDVRALGVPADDGPADRVDVILLTQ